MRCRGGNYLLQGVEDVKEIRFYFVIICREFIGI